MEDFGREPGFMRMSFLRRMRSRETASRPRPVAAFLLSGLAMLSACSGSDVMRPNVDVGQTTAAVPARGLQALVPSNPFLAGYPRPANATAGGS